MLDSIPKSFAAAGAVVLAMTSAANADDADDKRSVARNAVTTNPIRYGILHFQVEYERTVSQRWSLFLSPIAFHHALWYPPVSSDDATATGYGIDFGARWFLTGRAPTGVFAGPFLSAYRGAVTTSGVES